MPFTCPQCGARFPTDQRCQDHFNTSQLQEMEQPAYYAVHHLSVPCYMLQHNAYSRQGWLAVRDLLNQFVYRGLTPEDGIANPMRRCPSGWRRRQNRTRFDSGRRTWSITKGDKLPGVENIAWTRTIADVRLETAEVYCADVREWAKSILADSETLVKT